MAVSGQGAALSAVSSRDFEQDSGRTPNQGRRGLNARRI